MKALLIVDHGSVRCESNIVLEEVASLIQTLRPDLFVHFAHMEIAEPSIARALHTCIGKGAEEIIVLPYMLAPGRHASQDIPRLVAVVAKGYPNVLVRVTEPLGVHQKIAQVVLERSRL